MFVRRVFKDRYKCYIFLRGRVPKVVYGVTGLNALFKSLLAVARKVRMEPSVPKEVADRVSRRLGVLVNQDKECLEMELSYKAVIGMGQKEEDDILGRKVKDEWAREIGLVTTDYENVTDRADFEQATVEGLAVFCTPRKKETLSRETVAIALLDIMMNYRPRKDDKFLPVPFVQCDRQGSYIPKDRGTGYLPGVWEPVKENKIDTYFDVSLMLLGYKYTDENVPLLPYRTMVKGEVMKVSSVKDGRAVRKRNRVIQVASAFDVQFGHNAVYQPMRFVTSNFYGAYPDLEMSRGGSAKVVYDILWKDKVLFERDGGLEDNWSQSDQKMWEGSVHLSSVKMYMFHWMSVMEWDSLPLDEVNLFEAFWRNNLYPIYPIGGNRFFCKPGTKPSGTVLTSSSNTWQHIYTKLLFSAFVKRHNYRVGCGCFCDECEAYGENQSFDPEEIEREQLLFGVCSDDYIGLETKVSGAYRNYCSRNLGLRPETEISNLYKGVEFLRYLVKRDEEGCLWVDRETERVLNKFYHKKQTIDDMMETITSLVYGVGENKDLYDKLEKAWNKCIEYVGVDSVVERTFHSEQMGSRIRLKTRLPTFEYVVDFNTLDPKTIRDRALRLEYGKEYGSAVIKE